MTESSPRRSIPYDWEQMLASLVLPVREPGTKHINPDTSRYVSGVRVLHVTGDRRLLTRGRFMLAVIFPFLAALGILTGLLAAHL